MPRGDRTGPDGVGSMTGRAAGLCAGYEGPGCVNPAFGYGRGRGFGRGYGRRAAPAAPYNSTMQTPVVQDELAALMGEAEYLGGALRDIERRIEQVDSRSE